VREDLSDRHRGARGLSTSTACPSPARGLVRYPTKRGYQRNRRRTPGLLSSTSVD
jgi:hypothetical protein